MNEFTRKENETELEYHKRLIYGKLVDKTLADEDYSELSKEAYGKEYSSDVARRMMYGSKITLDLIEKDTVNNITDDKIIKEYELKKQELYKEQVKFYDQRRELNNILRSQSREEYLCTLIEDSIKNSNIAPFEYIPKNVEVTDNDILCFINDLHYGLEQENYWHIYNPKVFVQYLYKYLDEIVQIKNTHNSQQCYVFLGGDLISGLIHNLVRIENAENVVEQIQHVSEYISNFINELSKIFSHVYVFSVSGNHSRVMQDKKEAIKDEKLDSLVIWYLKARLSSLSNVFIEDNKIDSTIAVLDIRGKLYYGVHGDLDNPEKVVDSLTQMLDCKPYAVLMAHRHHYAINSIHNVKVISSGSFSSVDDYCITKRISGKPSQTVCICDKNGVICSYDIILN